MTYTVLLAIDSAGPFPIIVREGEELLGGPEVHFRFVVSTDDYAEAIRMVELLQRRQVAAGELPDSAGRLLASKPPWRLFQRLPEAKCTEWSGHSAS